MLAALETMRGEYGDGFAIEVVDVDADAVLHARYDQLVPVLVAQTPGDDRELCHYVLDTQAVHGHLGEIGLLPTAASDRLQAQ